MFCVLVQVVDIGVIVLIAIVLAQGWFRVQCPAICSLFVHISKIATQLCASWVPGCWCLVLTGRPSTALASAKCFNRGSVGQP